MTDACPGLVLYAHAHLPDIQPLMWSHPHTHTQTPAPKALIAPSYLEIQAAGAHQLQQGHQEPTARHSSVVRQAPQLQLTTEGERAGNLENDVTLCCACVGG